MRWISWRKSIEILRIMIIQVDCLRKCFELIKYYNDFYAVNCLKEALIDFKKMNDLSKIEVCRERERLNILRILIWIQGFMRNYGIKLKILKIK